MNITGSRDGKVFFIDDDKVMIDGKMYYEKSPQNLPKAEADAYSLSGNDWRDARKELPDDRRDVIIGNANNKCVSVGWWNGEHNNSEGKWLIRTAHFDGDVTHWKELPDPPTGI